MKYLKLGPKATIFHDPFTRILIRGTEVLAFKAIPKSKKLAVALAQGHVSWATEAEFDSFKEEGGAAKDTGPIVNRLTADGKDILYDLSPEDFKEMVLNSGYSKADQKAILKAEDKVIKYREIAATYDE